MGTIISNMCVEEQLQTLSQKVTILQKLSFEDENTLSEACDSSASSSNSFENDIDYKHLLEDQISMLDVMNTELQEYHAKISDKAEYVSCNQLDRTKKMLRKRLQALYKCISYLQTQKQQIRQYLKEDYDALMRNCIISLTATYSACLQLLTSLEGNETNGQQFENKQKQNQKLSTRYRMQILTLASVSVIFIGIAIDGIIFRQKY